MSDETKTREELIAEIAALKNELEQRGAEGGKPASKGWSAPVFSAPSTRRQSLVGWVAPVILSMPVLQGIGVVLKPGLALAVQTKQPTMVKPLPTFAATAAPTVAATAAPTKAGVCLPAPTAAA